MSIQWIIGSIAAAGVILYSLFFLPFGQSFSVIGGTVCLYLLALLMETDSE